MNILIDECLHTSLVEVAIEHGHQATHVTWRGMGGMQDWNLMEPIREESLTFVTNNAKDFRRLYAQAELHAGLLIIVPQVPPAAQRELFAALLEDIAGEELLNEVVEIALVEGEAAINRYPLPDEPGEPEEATEHDA